jgi:hypothetical protein
MNLRSSSKMLATTKSDAPGTRASALAVQQWSQYLACVGTGLVGGAAGVALAIGLAIVAQLLLPPPAVFAPGTIPLLVLATVSGLGISGLLGRGAQRILPGLFHSLGEQGLQVILVSSVFASLLQTLLFFAHM